MTIKIYHSSDSVLVRSTERDVELTRAEFEALKNELAPKPAPTPDVASVFPPTLSVAAKPTLVKSRYGEPWTKEEDERLLAGRRRGEPAAVTAKALGRTEGACGVRLATKYKGYSANLAAAAE